MNKTHSFSTKTASDLELVDKIRRDAHRSGRSFSWIIIQALKAYELTKSTNNDKRKD